MPTTTDRAALIEELAIRRELRDREYASDCKLWVHEQVWTRDEDSGSKRKWPDTETYLDELFDYYESEQLIAIPKSRQLLVSWSFAAWMTWRARYQQYQALFIQSTKAETAAHVVDKRCKFIEDNLSDPLLDQDDPDRGWCRREYKQHRTTNGLVGRMAYHRTESEIISVGHGTDMFRSYVPTAIAIDESEFQRGSHGALQAAMPFAREGKNTKILLISSSNGPSGPLAEICKEAGFVKWS